MDRPDSIEKITSVYELGYYSLLKYQGTLELTLMSSIKSILENASNKKQRELLGDNAYVDYKKYEQQIKENKYDNFHNILDYIFPGMFNLPQEKESSLLEYMVKENEIPSQDLICAKLAKDHFSIKEFKEYIYNKELEQNKN